MTVFVRKVLTIAALAVLAAVAAGAKPAPVEDTRPPLLRQVGIDQRLNQQLPLDVVFRNESGQRVPLRTYFGRRPVILTLVYYECPMLCNQVLNGLVSALRVLKFDAGREFDIVTVSFNPRETPALAAEKKQNYLARYKRPTAVEGWHFLTGEPEAIDALTRAVGFRYAYDPATKQFAHASAILVLTPDGRIARYFYGIEYAPKDLRLGLVEASQGKVGNLVDQVLLYCFHYDPATGKYGAIAMNIMRIGAVLTVLLLGGFMTVMWRRDARAKPVAGGRAT
ncbi:MAG TPA: SCO family protein [Terriglobales bacterium]|nr:SCO family protein [Terriglobales bacterium]